MTEDSSVCLIPHFLSDEFVFNAFRCINITHLYVGLLSFPVDGNKTKYISIFKTPHFMFVQHILKKVPLKPTCGYTDYGHYLSIHPQSHSEEQFRQLISDIRENGYDWQKRPILVFRHWSRPRPLNRWDVADGFHRLAILAALGEHKINVGILRYKKDIFERALARLLS